MEEADRLDSTLSELASTDAFRGAVGVESGGSTLLDAAYGADGAGTP